MNHVLLLQQQLGQKCAVLAGYAGDQGDLGVTVHCIVLRHIPKFLVPRSGRIVSAVQRIAIERGTYPTNRKSARWCTASREAGNSRTRPLEYFCRGPLPPQAGLRHPPALPAPADL